MESFEEYGRDELMPILISSIGNGVATSQTYPPNKKKKHAEESLDTNEALSLGRLS